MRSDIRDLLTGLAAIAALAGLATLLLAYGELYPRLFDDRWRLDVRLDNGGNLRAGSKITLDGVEVGEVAAVRLAASEEFPDRPVLAEAMIDRSQRIPADSVAMVQSSLLGGGGSLAIRSPEAGRSIRPDHSADDSVVPTIEGTTRDLTMVVEDLRVVARTYTELGENINDLFAPLELDAVDAEGSLRTTVVRWNNILAKADGTMDDVREAVWRIKVGLEQVPELIDTYKALPGSLEADADEVVALLDRRTAELIAAVVPVAEDSSELLQRLGELSRLATEGDGTVGRLLNSPDLYHGLVESTRRLEITLRGIELLIEKIREEGLGVSFD